MKLSKTSFGIPLAALLLVGAAGAVMATSGTPAAPVIVVPAAATPTPAPSSGTGIKPPKDDVLTGVLDGLVAKGTISAAQEKAILDGVTAERKARQDTRKAAMERAKADRQQIKGFLADGVITRDEFEKLPADSYLRKLTTLMDDGRITTDELKALHKGLFGGGMGQGKGHMGGAFGRGWGGNGGMNPKASAAPSTGG